MNKYFIMKKFFNDLISGTSDKSSKRFAALFTLLNIIILTYLAAGKNNWITPEHMFDALCIIAGGGLGLTVIEKIFSKKNKNEGTPEE
jgi:hypothetical protein